MARAYKMAECVFIGCIMDRSVFVAINKSQTWRMQSNISAMGMANDLFPHANYVSYQI